MAAQTTYFNSFLPKTTDGSMCAKIKVLWKSKTHYVSKYLCGTEVYYCDMNILRNSRLWNGKRKKWEWVIAMKAGKAGPLQIWNLEHLFEMIRNRVGTYLHAGRKGDTVLQTRK